MKTDMSPYGVTELALEEGDRKLREGGLDRLWEQLANGGVAAAVAIYARVWPLAHKPKNISGANAILNAD